MERKNVNKSIAIITKKYNIKNRKGETVAYTIISQNNTTTTLSDENGNVITVPARVTLATSTDYTITKVNNNSVDLVDGDGKVIRGVPACVVLAGGGGGDSHNKGYFATQAALEEAHPTAEAGDYAIVGATDTVWVWDEDTSVWKDSDTKGQVTSVNGQTGDVTLTASDVSALPTAGGTMTGAINMGSNDITFKDLANNTVTVGNGGQIKGIAVNGDIVLANGKVYSKGFGLTRESGNTTYPWAKTYTKNINNGADIAVPTTGGTMAVQVSSLPTAGSTLEGQIYQYTGATDSTYTHGYLYECKAQGTDPETYAWEAVEVQAGGGGGSSYTAGIGIDITNDVISTDVPMAIAPVNTDAPTAEIKAYPGTELQEGDGAIAIGPGAQAKTTSTSQYASFTGTVVIGEKALATSNAIHAVALGNLATVQTANSVAIGYNSLSKGNGGVAIGGGAQVNGSNGGVAIGGHAHAAKGAIILSAGNNGIYEAAQGCFDVVLNDTALATPGQYTLLKYGGLMPADRLASTTGLADGNYRLRLVMASGVPTLEWVAE